MGTHTRYHGTLTIEPPLTWAEIQQSDAWPGHPDHQARGFYSSVRYGTRLTVDTETVEMPEGYRVAHTGTGVEIVGEELRHNGVMDDLRALASLFGAAHRFVGVLECRHDHPGVETPFRVRIVGTEVEEVWPVMFWPDDLAVVEVVADALRYRAVTGEPGESAAIAATVLKALATTHTKKG